MTPVGCAAIPPCCFETKWLGRPDNLAALADLPGQWIDQVHQRRPPKMIVEVPDHLLAHLSPLGWEHVNLTGDYVWSGADQSGADQRTVNADGYRPLRAASEATLPAA